MTYRQKEVLCMGDLALIRALQEAPEEVKRAALRLMMNARCKEDAAAVTTILIASRRKQLAVVPIEV